jgi:hypothetical protein
MWHAWCDVTWSPNRSSYASLGVKREDAGGPYVNIHVALGIELEWWRYFPGVGVCGSSFGREPKREVGRRGGTAAISSLDLLIQAKPNRCRTGRTNYCASRN